MSDPEVQEAQDMSELDLAPLKFAYNAVVTADDKARVLVGAFPLLVGEIERLRGRDKPIQEAIDAINNVFNVHENHLFPDDVNALQAASTRLERMKKDFEPSLPRFVDDGGGFHAIDCAIFQYDRLDRHGKCDCKPPISPLMSSRPDGQE